MYIFVRILLLYKKLLNTSRKIILFKPYIGNKKYKNISTNLENAITRKIEEMKVPIDPASRLTRKELKQLGDCCETVLCYKPGFHHKLR